jgi:hypothetical protein
VAKNFGFNVGGGGIANLVQAPKVTPVRSVQFAPTPRRQTQRDEKDPKKQILGALLGASSPFLAEAGLELADKAGLGNLLFKDKDISATELGITDPDFGTGDLKQKTVLGELGTSAPLDPIEVERIRLRNRIDQALPLDKKMLPRQKTMFGKGLTELLTFAPAFALAGEEDDGGVASYISAAQSGKKLERALDQTRLDNYLKRATARDTALTKDVDLTRSITYGAYLDSDTKGVVQIKRDVLTNKDGSQRYVISQADPKIDVYVDENGKRQIIRAGEAYINRNLTLDDADIPSSQVRNFIDTESNDRAVGYFYPAVMQPDGTRKPMTIIADPEGGRSREKEEWRTLKRNWILDSPGIEGGPKLSAGRTERGKLFEDLDLQFGALNNTLNSGRVVLQLAQEEVEGGKGAKVFTKADTFLNKLASSLNLELDAVSDFLETQGTSTNQIIRSQLHKDQPSGNVMGVFAAANNHARAYQNYVAEQPPTTQQQAAMDQADNALITALNRLEQSSQSGAAPAFSLGNSEAVTNAVVQRGRLIAAQIRLAYAAAASAGQEGRTLSDKDVANFLQQVGYDSNNARDVGTRTAEFIATQIRDADSRSAIFSDLKSLSAGSDTDLANQRIADLVKIPKTKLNKLLEVGSDGKFVLSDEEAQALQSEIQTDISRLSTRAAPYFIYDPKSRRFKFRSFEADFRNRAQNDPIAMEFLRDGGYFDTFGINKNTFLYDFVGQSRAQTPSTQNIGTGGTDLTTLKKKIRSRRDGTSDSF